MRKIAEDVTRSVLDNGLTVLLKRRQSSPTVAIYTYVKAGYFDEPDRCVGISHLIEHMFFKGTRRRAAGEMAQETKSLGGYLNASTIYDHTLYYTVVPSRNFSQALEIQADALINPTFDATELKKETEVVIQEAKRKLDSPAAVTREQLFNVAFTQHRIRRWRIGTEEGLRGLTRGDFLEFHKNLYRPENIVLVVVGDVDVDHAFREIRRCYSSLPKGRCQKTAQPAEPPQREFRMGRMSGDIQQSYVAFGFHTPGLFHPDSYALEMLGIILGAGRSSRLYREVKEKQQQVKSISAGHYALQDFGIFQILASAELSRLEAARSAVVFELAALHSDTVTTAELKKARNMLLSSYVDGFATAAGLAGALASYEGLGDFRLLDKHMECLFRVCPGDIKRVAREYLRLSNLTVFEYVQNSAEGAAPDPRKVEAKLKPLFEDNSTAGSDSPIARNECFTVLLPMTVVSKDLERIELSQQLTLLLKENHEVPAVSAGVFIPGGRQWEKIGNAGISNLMTRTMLRGTQKRSAAEIASMMEGLGADLRLSAEYDYLSFSVSTVSSHFEAVWEIFSDVLSRPTFTGDEIKNEQDDICAQLLRLRDDMFHYPLQQFYATVFGGHPYGLPPLGNAEEITGIGTSDLSKWHRRAMAGEITVVVVGDVDASRFKEMLLESIAETVPSRPGRALPVPGTARFEARQKTVSVQKEQSAIILGFDGPAYSSRDYDTLRVVQNMLSGLGGRFFEELRGRLGLAYSVSTFAVARLLGGCFLAYIATSPDKQEAARAGLMKEFTRFCAAPPDKEDVERAIRYTTGTFEIGMETYRAQMRQLAHWELMGQSGENVSGFRRRIEQVTPERVFEAAQSCFDLDKMGETIFSGRAGSMEKKIQA